MRSESSVFCEASVLCDVLQKPIGDNLRGLAGRMTVLAWVDPKQARHTHTHTPTHTHSHTHTHTHYTDGAC